MAKKTCRLEIRLTEAELEELRQRAKFSGATVTDYVKESSLSRRLSGYVAWVKSKQGDQQVEGQMDFDDYPDLQPDKEDITVPDAFKDLFNV